MLPSQHTPSSTKPRTILMLLNYVQLVFFIGVIFYVGRVLLIPLFYGLFIAIVLYPVCLYLEHKGLPKALAVTICLLAVTILIIALLFLLVFQVKAFLNDIPLLQKQILISTKELQQWIGENLNLSLAAQTKWIENSLNNVKENLLGYLQGTFLATINALFIVLMIPIYTALFLYNRKTFFRFLNNVAGEKYKLQLQNIIHSSLSMYPKYVKGIFLVYIVVGILNSIGLLALGVKHAVLFGMLTAVMTIIPYLGIIVAASLPVTVAWVATGSIWLPLGVIGVFAFVQYLEANVIFPRIVGTQLNLNTWTTLVFIVAGGIIWGVSGMILFVPVAAILKIIADNVDEWKSLRILFSRNI